MNNRGSFTVEAALALPVFIFSIAAFIFLFRVILLQVQLQGAMTEASTELQGLAYVDVREKGHDGKQSQFESLSYKVLAKTEIEKYFLKKSQYESLLVRKISYGKSNYERDEGTIDLVASYTIRIPLPVISISTMPVCQRVHTRAFIGVEHLLSLNGESGDDKGENGEYVYITETGTVYHLKLSCSALNLKISQCKRDDIESKRNAAGGKYKKCERCFKGKEEAEHVFICEDGDRYHASLSCSGLKRIIKKVPLEEVKDKVRACYRCGRENEK